MVEFEEVERDNNPRQMSTITIADDMPRGHNNRSRTQSRDRRLRHFASTSSTLNNTPTNTPQISRDQSKERPSGDMALADLARDGKRSSMGKRLGDYCLDELDERGMGAVIIACFFTSGLVDAVAFNSWNCFVGMQTGNTVFAALGLSGQPEASHREQYYKSLVAIAAFVVGTLFFNFIHRLPTGLGQAPSSRRRVIFSLSFFLQTILLLVAAIEVQIGLVSNQPYISGTFSSGSHTNLLSNRHYADLAPIAILSFQAAGQVCLSRVLSLIELPTIVLSTLFHDFTADLYNTRRSWQASSDVKDFVFDKFRRQQKRFYSIVALFIGAFAGGEMYCSNVGMAGALWLAVGIKLVISIGYAVWPREKSSTPDSPV